jgi:hypothetical protein
MAVDYIIDIAVDYIIHYIIQYCNPDNRLKQ